MSNPNSSHSSMKFRLWWRQLLVSPARMTIQPQLPWPLRFLAYIVAAVILVCLVLTYDRGRVPGFAAAGGPAQIQQLREQVAKLTAERDQYVTTANAAETKETMDSSEQRQLVVQVKSLEAENAKLKEDLAFFEGLLPVDANAQGISIRRLKSEVIVPNQLHYQLLLMQGGKGEHDFVGNLQLTVTVVQAGKTATLVFPAATATDADKFKLTFKHYQRVDGSLTLPDGAVAKVVQARILDKGQIRAQQSINL